jgi:hypothetical protein
VVERFLFHFVVPPSAGERDRHRPMPYFQMANVLRLYIFMQYNDDAAGGIEIIVCDAPIKGDIWVFQG